VLHTTHPPAFGTLPEKYVLDFTLLLQDPRFLVQINPAQQIEIATKILRGKGERVTFEVIGSFFRVRRVRRHRGSPDDSGGPRKGCANTESFALETEVNAASDERESDGDLNENTYDEA
jgi:hypothetical protein